MQGLEAAGPPHLGGQVVEPEAEAPIQVVQPAPLLQGQVDFVRLLD